MTNIKKPNVITKYYNCICISKRDYLWLQHKRFWFMMLSIWINFLWLLPVLGPFSVLMQEHVVEIRTGEILFRCFLSLCILFLSSLFVNSDMAKNVSKWRESIQCLKIGWFQIYTDAAITSYRMNYLDEDAVKQYYLELVHHYGTKKESGNEYYLEFDREYHGQKIYRAVMGCDKLVCYVMVTSDELLFQNRDRRIDFVPQARLLLIHSKHDHLEKHFSEIRKRVMNRRS